MSRTVYLVDRTTTRKPSAEWLASMRHALRLSLDQFSVDWYFAHVWHVEIVPPGVQLSPLLPPGAFAIVLVDEDTSVQGALGYHYRNADGTPAAVVMTKTILDNGGTWTGSTNSVSVCVDHEAKETVLDMAANSYSFDERGRAWALEACDAVQSSSFPGPNGITLSNYVLPGYFVPEARGRGVCDKLGRLTQPFSIDRGGYAIVANLSGETEKFGDLAAMGFEIHADPSGRGALVVDPELPEYVRALKLPAASRTMRRLVRQQR